jgi:peptidoglycan/xylan/chitin deacetylase (PgdA/CDA1 family)
LSEGHTVAHHTFSHPLLNRMPFAAAEAEIDRGFAAVDTALYGRFERMPRTPFFRFPGFASSQALLDRLERRGIVVFGADLWASDWTPMSPPVELSLVLARVEDQSGRNRAVPRYQGANHRHARRLSARAEKPRLPSRARRSGGGALSRAERRFLGARVAPSQAS